MELRCFCCTMVSSVHLNSDRVFLLWRLTFAWRHPGTKSNRTGRIIVIRVWPSRRSVDNAAANSNSSSSSTVLYYYNIRAVGKVLNAEKRVRHDKNLAERNIIYHSTHARAGIGDDFIFIYVLRAQTHAREMHAATVVIQDERRSHAKFDYVDRTFFFFPFFRYFSTIEIIIPEHFRKFFPFRNGQIIKNRTPFFCF